MKSFFARGLSLCLMCLFAAGLLTVPASAVGETEDAELPPYTEDSLADMSWFEDAAVKAAVLAVQHAYQEQWAEEAAAQAGVCNNPNHSKTYQYAYLYMSGTASGHTKVTMKYKLCTICESSELVEETSTREGHQSVTMKYMSSNHSGSYTKHTHTYGGTCACGYTITRSVSAGCTAGGCVDPYSVTEP
mgnify:FL=1